jgi:hypothetical protein
MFEGIDAGLQAPDPPEQIFRQVVQVKMQLLVLQFWSSSFKARILKI